MTGWAETIALLHDRYPFDYVRRQPPSAVARLVWSARTADLRRKVWDQWLVSYQVYLTQGDPAQPFPDFEAFYSQVTARPEPATDTQDDVNALIMRQANRARKRFKRAQEEAT